MFDINEHPINLESGKQLFYSLIYSLAPVELEIFKTYIKTNLANSFICPFKFFISISIFFIQKSDKNFRLCINYQGLNNLIIKKGYLLLFISELLNQLGQAKQFI